MSMPCDAREPVLCSPNEMNKLLMAYDIPLSSEATESAKAESSDNGTICCEDPGILTPNHGEVSTTTRLCVVAKAIISMEGKLSASWHSPFAEAALMPPSLSPVSSIQDVPSCLLEDELKQHLPMVMGQHKPTSIVSSSLMASVDTHLARKPSKPSLAPRKAVDQSSVSSPIHSETVITPPIHMKVSSPTRRSGEETVISKEGTSTCMCSSSSSASLPLPKLPPTIPKQAILPHPSNDETKMPSLMASKTICQPVKKVDINNKQTSMNSCLLVPAVTIKLPSTAAYKQAAPSHSSREELKPPLQVAPESLCPIVSKRMMKIALCSPSFLTCPTSSSFLCAITSCEAKNKPKLPV